MDKFALSLLVHTAATWVMVGIMWFVQTVHYPLYRKIHEGFVSYERCHLRRAAWLMGPVMIVEVITALFLIGLSPSAVLTKLASINFVLLILIWVSTCLFQVQQHQMLSIRFSRKIHHNLLNTNWVRTALWTARGILVLVMLGLFVF
ncbi:MAG TPA: hypothetical protein PLO43_01135 [Chlamydiales bacterium]|nr:hypothetical protein [Chlamydiales bacterium]